MIAIFVSVVPDVIWVFQSNECDQAVGCLQDDQCNVTANGKRSSEAEILLTCAGPPSSLFDGVIGGMMNHRERNYYSTTRGDNSSHPGLMLQCSLILHWWNFPT